MKKYYAIEEPSEEFEPSRYYDELQAMEDHIWWGRNDRLCEANVDLRENIVNSLEDAYSDMYDDDMSREDYDAAFAHHFAKKDKTPLTTQEHDKLVGLVRDFESCFSRDENRIICQVLEILRGEPFSYGAIRGASQGDWLEIIYPTSRANSIPYIQAVLFGTGTEFRITTEAVEADEVEEADCYCDYTELWKSEDIRAWLCNSLQCKPEELVIKKIAAQHTYVKYDYEEI